MGRVVLIGCPPLGIGAKVPNIYFEELFDELGCPKPTPASQALPNWYKDMPRFFGPNESGTDYARDLGTIRDCPAINDAMFSGYMLYLPADVYIDASGKEVFYDIGSFGRNSRIKDSNFDFILSHDSKATKGYQSMFDFHEQTLKWQTYWGIRTEEGYSSLFIHPFHRSDLPFYSVTAIVDTDKFATRDPYAFFIKDGFKGVIQRGTPMLQVIPFKRDDWQMHIVQPDAKDFHKNRQMMQSVFKQPYKKMFWQRKKYS